MANYYVLSLVRDLSNPKMVRIICVVCVCVYVSCPEGLVECTKYTGHYSRKWVNWRQALWGIRRQQPAVMYLLKATLQVGVSEILRDKGKSYAV